MPEGLMRLFAARPLTQIIRDLVDILVVAWVIYRALLVLRGTRAIQMAVGLGIALLVFLGARTFHFVTLQNLLSWLLSSIVLIVVVVFQNDIRRALMRMGQGLWWTSRSYERSEAFEEIIRAAERMAHLRIGALIVFERGTSLAEFMEEGTALDATVSKELLYTIFIPSFENPMHDGALVIRDGFPVSPGHTLIIPKRHVGSWFDITDAERDEMTLLLTQAKAQLDQEYTPDGYNIGINDGAAAGQTVPHLHMHLIPRFTGDSEDPRGGVRWIMPEKADYWSRT